MLGDRDKEIIANTLDFVSVSRTNPFSLYNDYVHEIEYMERKPGVFQSDFYYTIRYAPMSTFKKHLKKPFLLKIDFYDTIKIGCHRFESFEALCNDETFGFTVPFLMKYTELSQDIFDLAQENPYCEISLGFKTMQYVNDVKEKYKQEHNGEEIEHFIFLSKYMLLTNAYMNEEKIASREASKNKRVKGVINK